MLITFPLHSRLTWTADVKDGWEPVFNLRNITIRDVAHGLSLVNRFCGATDVGYSVAEHSVHLAEWLKRDERTRSVRRFALLHDVSEALGCADAHGALKKAIAPGVRTFEGHLIRYVWYHLTGSPYNPLDAAEVKERDHAYGNYEAKWFGFPNVWQQPESAALPPSLRCWSAVEAERKFLESWEEYR